MAWQQLCMHVRSTHVRAAMSMARTRVLVRACSSFLASTLRWVLNMCFFMWALFFYALEPEQPLGFWLKLNHCCFRQTAPDPFVCAIVFVDHPETRAPQKDGIWACTDADLTPNPFVHPTQWDAFTSDPDHSDLIESVSEITSNIKIETSNSMSQKQRQNAIPKLTTKMIAAIARQVNDGAIKLPDLDCNGDEDFFAIWALVASSSSVHAIDADKLLPNAPKKAPPKGHKGFRAANGETIPHGGLVATDVS